MKLLYGFVIVLLFFAVVSIVMFQGGETRFFADLNDLYNNVISFGFDFNIVIEEFETIYDCVDELRMINTYIIPTFLEDMDPSDIGGSLLSILQWGIRLVSAPFRTIEIIGRMLWAFCYFAAVCLIDSLVFVYKLFHLFVNLLMPSKYT